MTVTPFIGEVRMYGGLLAPDGWRLCDGSSLRIALYGELYSLIGTTYGGDGQQTFNLPDLRGRVPIHRGPGYDVGRAGGEEQHQLVTAELPTHTHPAMASTAAGSLPDPFDRLLARSTTVGTFLYLEPDTPPPPAAPMLPLAIGQFGGGFPHDNMQPFLAINFIIALQGQYPQPRGRAPRPPGVKAGARGGAKRSSGGTRSSSGGARGGRSKGGRRG